MFLFDKKAFSLENCFSFLFKLAKNSKEVLLWFHLLKMRDHAAFIRVLGLDKRTDFHPLTPLLLSRVSSTAALSSLFCFPFNLLALCAEPILTREWAQCPQAIQQHAR